MTRSSSELVATCAGDDWDVDELFALVRSTQPYRELPHKDFDDVLAMLSDGIVTSRGRRSRMAAIMSGGAIPETANYNVVAEPEGTVIGNVDEDSRSRVWPATSSYSARPRG